MDSLFQNKSLYVAFLSIISTFIQFLGYGLGFLESKFYPKKIAYLSIPSRIQMS